MFLDARARSFGSLLRPTLADLLGVFLVVAVIGIGAQRLFGDSDPAMHVATGRLLLAQGAVPRTDPFSATHGGKEWFAHEWLADAAWALVHRFAGWPGILAVSAALVATTHVLLYRFLLRRGAQALPAFAAAIAAAAAASSHWLARPHLLTTLLLVVWTATLDDVCSGRSRTGRLWVLPPLAALWANLHGGFLVAFPVLACYGVTALRSNRRVVGPLVVAGAGSALAVLANPWGWRLPAHLLSYFAVGRQALSRNAEFAPATLADPAGAALFGVVALAVVAQALSWRLRRKGGGAAVYAVGAGPLLAFVFTSAMAIQSIRHAEIAAIFAALLLAAGLSSILDASSGPEARRDWAILRGREARCGGGAFGAAVAVAAVAALLGFPSRAGYDPRTFPVEMVRSLRAEGVAPRGPLFSRDLWGGYLALEWPEVKVFVDGRSDMYGDAFMSGYADLYEAKAGWRAGLDAWGVEWALLPRDAPLATALAADPRWVTAKTDAVAILFRRGPPA